MQTERRAEQHSEYRHIRLGDDVIACRDSGGNGATVLFLHGFASFSWTWEAMLRHMPEEGFRYLRVDLAGFGFSLGNSETALSIYDQAELVKRLILQLDLRRITLVGHGFGGEIALILSLAPEILSRLDRLCLIACRAPDDPIPDYISQIASLSLTGGGRGGPRAATP